MDSAASSSQRPGQLPPPLPPEVTAPKKKSKGCLLGFLITVGCFLILGLMFAGAGALFVLTAKEFVPSDAQKACVLTVEDAAEWFEIDIKPEGASWDCSQYFDRSVEIIYFYEDWEDEEIFIDCTLTIERKASDALLSYNMEWSGLKVSNQFGENDVSLERDDDLFRWGDESKFAFQVTDGKRNGFAFIGRKGKRIFFLDCWGLILEDHKEIAEFLGPHLERFEKESF